MESILTGITYTFWFLIILTVVVFIHEFGHFIVARFNKVKVEIFSIGFGREIFGRTDKHGTRWKFSFIPLGGYVKMFGDQDPSSAPDSEKLEGMSFKDKQVSFHFKTLRQKAAIVVAGPLFNYMSAIIIIAAISFIYGTVVTEPVITTIVANSPAEHAGLKIGDEIIEIDGSTIESFEDARQILALNTAEHVEMLVMRDNEEVEIEITPELTKVKDAYGNEIQMPIIGIASNKIHLKQLNFVESVSHSFEQTYQISTGMLKALGQIIAGERGVDQLGGPIKIAQYSGQSAKHGVVSVMFFIALISINLGLLNLLPLPMLDGGHLMYYAIEAITGKPVGEKFQLAAMRVTFFLLISLMIFVTFNDIRSLIAL